MSGVFRRLVVFKLCAASSKNLPPIHLVYFLSWWGKTNNHNEKKQPSSNLKRADSTPVVLTSCLFGHLFHSLKLKQMISAKTQCKQHHHITAVCCLTTCWGVFLGTTFLIEQNGSNQDYHLNHDCNKGLQGLMESDDLQATTVQQCTLCRTDLH